MSDIQCGNPDCGLPGQHVQDCQAPDDCRGCLPALAADGLRLCPWHTGLIPDDVIESATRYAAMADHMARPPASTEPSTSGTRIPGLDLADAWAEAREAIRSTLRQLVALIARERGMTRPADDVDQMALWIAAQATWIAARPDAGQWSQALRDLRLDPRTGRLAYPARAVRASIGVCPLDGCGTRLHATPGDPVVSCEGCGATGTAEQWQQILTGRTDAVVDAYAAAERLSTLYYQPISPATVRKWGERGRIDRLTAPDPSWTNAAARADCKPAPGTRAVSMRDRQGRALFWWASILGYAARIYGQPA